MLGMSNVLTFYPEDANTAIYGKVILLGVSNMLTFYPEYTNTAILGEIIFSVDTTAHRGK